MAKFFYTNTISNKEIVEAELNQRFADLLLKANTTKFDIHAFRKRAARYRHLQEPLILLAVSEKVGPLIHGALNLANTWNWTNAIVEHSQTAPNAPNASVLSNPVIYLHASYFSHDWEAGAYEIGIGYSTDGVTYNLWTYSPKFVGYTQAHTSPPWSNKTTHYHTGAVTNWWSNTMYGKRETHSSLMVKSQNGVDITTITHWAIGIRANGTLSNGNATKNIHELDVAKLILIARDST